MFINIKKRKSFTLAELVISIGLLGLVLTLTAGVLVSVVRSYARQRIIAEMERNGDFVSRVLYEKIRVAQTVTCSNGTTDVSDVPCQNLTADNPVRSTSKFLKIVNPDHTAEYIGVGELVGAATCETQKNNLIYIVNDPGSVGSLTNDDALTNSAIQGVQVESFESSIITPPVGPSSVTLKIGLKQSVCENLFTDDPERKSFDIFVTVRSTYK